MSHLSLSYWFSCLHNDLQDSTIEFEKRRNVPVRYNRELVQTTVKAMKRIAEIKQKREHAFWKNRSVHLVLRSPTLQTDAVQDGCREGKAQGAQKTHPREDLDQACPTYYPPGGKDQGEDQGCDQNAQCTHCRRGSVNGDGDRLSFGSICALLPFSIFVSLCFAVSPRLMYCYVMYSACYEAMKYVPGNVY